MDLTAGAKTYKLTDLFPVPVAQDFDLVVKYQSADISDSVGFQTKCELAVHMLAVKRD